MSNEQTHPLHATDKNIIDSLITKKKPEDFDLINLARLINRYDNFPGEIEIKEDIKKTLKFWKISQNMIFFLRLRNYGQIILGPQIQTKDLVGSGFDTSN